MIYLSVRGGYICQTRYGAYSIRAEGGRRRQWVLRSPNGKTILDKSESLDDCKATLQARIELFGGV